MRGVNVAHAILPPSEQRGTADGSKEMGVAYTRLKCVLVMKLLGRSKDCDYHCVGASRLHHVSACK